jgi:superfamily II DNA or RNA helicase
VLPPGAGKTRVGLETALARTGAGEVSRVVVLGPNTAIQAQWLAQARTAGLEAGTDRALGHPVTVLTYQSLAVFDPDAEVDDDGAEESLLARLHDNGRALVEAMQREGHLLLVLDECHHLLEVWGELLAELLALLPDAEVLGLTATPPEALTKDQAALVSTLFGEVASEATIPALVREGDLAPFAELAWLTTPTTAEAQWLEAEGLRFQELVAVLTDPTVGSVPFLEWVDRRFVAPVGETLSWLALTRKEPELTTAALRLHHAGLLALPEGARPGEQHQQPPTVDDWVRLAEDWLCEGLDTGGTDDDARVLDVVRRALPGVGYQWTRRGIRRGRSPVDRVLARSEAKTRAAVEIVGHEHLALGDRLRMLVLCDHERASATLPSALEGVLDQQAGSAWSVLTGMLDDPVTAGLGPLLVTGSTVSGSPETLAALHELVGDERLRVVADDAGGHRLEGPWSSRTWVPHVTRFFEEGKCRVLVGTRGLLGEGWDARRISGLVDLTAATTATAVVQTRGRALRTDPLWPDKVALNWSVVCVTPDHPRGDNDWQRLVRKHDGFFGVDADGDVVDGVAHLDAAFSPYRPPPVEEFDAVNARMVVRSQQRDELVERWQVGQPYDDRPARAVRILPSRPGRVGMAAGPPAVVVRPGGLEQRADGLRVAPRSPVSWVWVMPAIAAAWFAYAVQPVLAAAVVAGIVGRLAWLRRQRVEAGRRLLREATTSVSVLRIACAVADGLHRAGLVSQGAAAVDVELDEVGDYRCLLRGVSEDQSGLFAEALDEVVSPIALPRYVVPRWVVTDLDLSPGRALAAADGRVTADAVVWHAVPTALGTNRTRAAEFAAAWDHWLGGGEAVATSSPEGAGVLAAQQDASPLDVTTVIRRHWS